MFLMSITPVAPQIAAPFVRSLIVERREELLEKIRIGAVNLYAGKAGPFGPSSCSGEGFNDHPDLVFGHGDRQLGGSASIHYCRWSHRGSAGIFRARGVSTMMYLQKRSRTMLVDSIGASRQPRKHIIGVAADLSLERMPGLMNIAGGCHHQSHTG